VVGVEVVVLAGRMSVGVAVVVAVVPIGVRPVPLGMLVGVLAGWGCLRLDVVGFAVLMPV
jgi:hypothetical protein